jgi:hypothetical protein
MKPSQYRIRLSHELGNMLAQIAESSGTNESAVASIILHCAAEAIKANGATLRLPLKFAVVEGPCASASVPTTQERPKLRRAA